MFVFSGEKFLFSFFEMVASSLIIDLLRVKLAPIHAIFHHLIGVKWRRRKDKWERMHTLTRERKQNGIQQITRKDLCDQEVAQCMANTTLNLFWEFFLSFCLCLVFTIQESIQFRCSMAGRCWFELLFLAFGLNQTDETRWVNEKSQHNDVVSFIVRVFV